MKNSMTFKLLLWRGHIACWAGLILALMGLAAASEITINVTDGYLYQPMVIINPGDKVTWLSLNSHSGSAIATYGPGFSSTVLTNGGPEFSVTFTNGGFWAYRTTTAQGSTLMPGVISVRSGTNAPPAVTINSPLDGFGFADGGSFGPTIPIQVSSTNALGSIREVDLLTNGVMLTALTKPPYLLLWNAPPGLGTIGITASIVEMDGIARTSAVTTISVGGPGPGILGPPRYLAGGQYVFLYSVQLGGERPVYLVSRDRVDPPPISPLWSFAKQVSGVGVFVDETAYQSSHRIYTVISAEQLPQGVNDK